MADLPTLNQTVNVSGVSATSAVGSLGVALAVIPQGQSGTISQGAATVQAGALVIPAGVTSATSAKIKENRNVSTSMYTDGNYNHNNRTKNNNSTTARVTTTLTKQRKFINWAKMDRWDKMDKLD